jgi:hypothetical protein
MLPLANAAVDFSCHLACSKAYKMMDLRIYNIGLMSSFNPLIKLDT